MSTRPIRVVIADDSAGARLALAAGLRRIPGVEVVGTANDGIEVVGKVLQLRPDLVTLDLDMPNRDGVSAAAAIHRHCPDTVLTLVSGSDGATAQNALAFAPNLPIEYIPKPAAGNAFDDWVATSLAPLIERLRERPVGGERGRVWRRAEERPQEGVEAVLVGASTGAAAAEQVGEVLEHEREVRKSGDGLHVSAPGAASAPLRCPRERTAW